ncbi:MAG: Trk system potassium transporter TrkA [Holosporales bacterium]|jgi:trk system potassium uptake protein TrkA|nr:Trk system potassium transporter TrkA [Holosporales bacterium]
MNVVVLGAGGIGCGIAKALSLGGHNVSIVDLSEHALSRAADSIDAKPVLGDATNIKTLKEADLQDADVVVAATQSDETNIIACQISMSVFGVETKIARISKFSYFNGNTLIESISQAVDYAVSPYREVSKIVHRNMLIPGSIEATSCIGDRLVMIGVVCKSGSAIASVPVKYITSIDEHGCVTILYLRKKDRIGGAMPGKSDIIDVGDVVYFACLADMVQHAMHLFGYTSEEINTAVVIGGSRLCEAIVTSAVQSGVAIKVVESDLSQAERLTAQFDETTTVLYGEPFDPNVLIAAGVNEAGVVISATDDDKTNVISCMLAKKLGARRVAAVMNDSSYSQILHSLGINAVLNARLATVTKALHFLRNGKVESVLTIEDGEVEVLEIDVREGCYAVGMQVSEIESKDTVQVTAIATEVNVLTMPKKSIISPGNKILITVRKGALNKVIRLFQNRPKYL